MKILLIYPPYTSHITDPIKANPPLGLAYIAAYLEKFNYGVEILDALALGIENVKRSDNDPEFLTAGLSNEEIGGYIKKSDPDVIGIYGGVTSNIHNSHNCARIAKEINPDIPVVFGGSHSTSCPDLVLRDNNIDIIVNGEGEITFLEIIKRIERDESISDTEGIIFRANGALRVNKERPYIDNLDSLPFPARHLLPMKIYAKVSRFARDHYMRHPRANMVSSRGCPGNCVFCSIHAIWGHKWRPRSAGNVLDEMELLVNEYGIREIAFYDDNISFDKKRLIEICKGIQERRLDIKWDTPNGVAIWTLDREVIRNMAKSGCYRLMFGIESACPKTQQFIRKKTSIDFCNRIIKYANDAGLWTQSTFVIGFPNEQMDSINETLNFIVKSDLDFVRVYIATPFPGTDLYEEFVKNGLIEDYRKTNRIDNYISVSYGGVNTKYFTSEELRKIQGRMYSRFIKSRIKKFLNPLRWIKKIDSFEDLVYTLKVGRIALEANLISSDEATKLVHQRKDNVISASRDKRIINPTS